jgi:hypothetical protein
MTRFYMRIAGRAWVFWGAALWFLASAELGAGDRLHVVQRNETLTGIARSHGLSVAELARHNGILQNSKLRVGQSLSIPGRGAPTFPSSPNNAEAPLDYRVAKTIERAHVQRGRWKYIVIHHSGVDSGTVQGMDRYHREIRHMENGLAYHFVIGNGNGMGDGEVAVGRRWTEQLDGGHVAREAQNRIALGICLVGNFDQDKPTRKQMASLESLVEALLTRCALPVSAVKTHQQINVMHTRCPGRNFPARAFLKQLKGRNG